MNTKAALLVIAALLLLAGCGGGGAGREGTGAEELTAPTEKTQIIEETTAPPEAVTDNSATSERRT